ncbi:MAG TPA: HWE histidine kinase domain-containing protein [Allosphingosinicella sp.]|nr:HWE histidine kinase domain-containing protein [Allosphingosinicella sp.]
MALHAPLSPADADAPVGERIRAFDWAGTPLGPMESWPEALRFALDMCLRSALPAALYVGETRLLLHNDAWTAMVGGEAALGLPVASLPHSLWPVVRELADEVTRTGAGAFVRERPLILSRNGLEEETWWNCHLLPIYAPDGQLLAILNQANEVTRTVVAEQRISFQVALAEGLRSAEGPEAVKHAATRLLGEHLGAARVGYAEVDETLGEAWVRSDWTADPAVQSLAGQSAELAAFGEEALAYLRSGEVLVLPDIRALGLGQDRLAGWERVGMRALITVPLVRGGALRALLYVHEPEARAWRRSEAAMARDVAERTWSAVEQAQAAQSLRDSEDHYRHTVELNPQVTWTALPDGRLNRVARRWQDWTGTTGLGSTWAEGLHPDDRERTFAVWGRSVATGEPYDIEHRVLMRDGSYRWARSRAVPRRADDGAICLWYGSTEDIHERKVAEEHQRLLINELNHRVKNTLATVQAIAFQTLKGDLTLAEARTGFEARLLALSKAHNLLTEQNWERASLERVVRDSLEHFAGGDRFALAGPEIWLAPRAALALALALHELATNAAKYGALSAEHGRVAIDWSDAGGVLRLDWKEQGGPAVAAPTRRGFGSRLIEQGLGGDLGGTARIAFEADGLRCTVEAQMSAVAAARELELG